jgi:MFS family permease
MFPQLGAPIGFLCSSGTFLLLTSSLNDAQLLEWGWRVPFLASALLVFVGLYVRLRLTETPAFQQAIENNERVRVPMATVIVHHPGTVVLATLTSMTAFLLFYLMTVFSLGWATTALRFSRTQFLILQMIGVLFFALTIPVSAVLADRRSRRGVLVAATVANIVFGLVMASLFGSGTGGALTYLCIGFAVMGFLYGPLGTFLGELFPTSVRYTGASVTFNLAGILGGALAPYLATYLAAHFGLIYVGYYLAGVGAVTLVALLLIREGQRSGHGAGHP